MLSIWSTNTPLDIFMSLSVFRLVFMYPNRNTISKKRRPIYIYDVDKIERTRWLGMLVVVRSSIRLVVCGDPPARQINTNIAQMKE